MQALGYPESTFGARRSCVRDRDRVYGDCLPIKSPQPAIRAAEACIRAGCWLGGSGGLTGREHPGVVALDALWGQVDSRAPTLLGADGNQTYTKVSNRPLWPTKAR